MALNNWGCEMTVAIAASVPTTKQIVTVCDARLSYGEAIPAADDATMKNRRIAPRWGMMFAAEDSTAFMPAAVEASAILQGSSDGDDENRNHGSQEVMEAARKGYEKEFNERFFREHLARFGFADIAEFRRSGFAEMGKDLYHEYAMKLARFDLGLELLVYGFSEDGHPSIFEVANPGKIISHSLRGHAAIGSGSLMAISALNRKPLGRSITDITYRLLDAKFSSETARDVGKKTFVVVLGPNGSHGTMAQGDVDKIRASWNKELKRANPKEAIKIIEKSVVVTATSSGKQPS
jgi:20S proteasome alpha/beta subunit